VLVLVLEQTGLLDRDSARLPVDGEELAQQCLREGSPQVEDGGKDPASPGLRRAPAPGAQRGLVMLAAGPERPGPQGGAVCRR
jgi:hypothetical protein